MNYDLDAPKSMAQLLEHIVEQTNGDRVTLKDILHSLGTCSYGPALLFVALVSMLPTISITPGLPVVTGLLIIALSAQLLILHP